VDGTADRHVMVSISDIQHCCLVQRKQKPKVGIVSSQLRVSVEVRSSLAYKSTFSQKSGSDEDISGLHKSAAFKFDSIVI
jgi:hypothetical protein